MSQISLIIDPFIKGPIIKLNSYFSGWISHKRSDIPSDSPVLDLIWYAWMDLQGDLIVSDDFELLLESLNYR